MSNQSSISAAVLAFTVALAGFSALSLTAPVGYPVDSGDPALRIVTDKEVYRQWEGGYATFEFYNPGPGQVSYGPPSPIVLGFAYNGVKEERGQTAYVDWISSNFTVPPGGTFKVFTFVLTTSKVGELTLSGLGVSKTVTVLPLEP
jgi:hypothetical protein